ncbi:MAG: ThuA domain-containing protein [Verrucomicrobiota bacterium]
MNRRPFRRTRTIIVSLLLTGSLNLLADEWDELLGPETLKKLEAAVPAWSSAAAASPRKVLVFTEPKKDFDRMAKSRTQKPVPHQSAPHAAKAIAMAGTKTGAFTVEVTGDPSVFKKDLRSYDAVVLANVYLGEKLFAVPRDFTQETKNPFAEAQKNLIEFVEGGGGLAAIHAPAAEALTWPAFNEMLGATCAGQAWQGFHETRIKPDVPDSPLNAAFGDQPFSVRDDIYRFKEAVRGSSRVLLSVDTASAPTSLWADRSDDDYPVSWIRSYGKGRVFYTALGHEPEMYFNRAFLRHLLAGVQFATGDLKADTTPGKALPPRRGGVKKMAGWTPLFDGTDLSAFKVSDAQKLHWIVDNGLLRYDGRANTLSTQEKYGDFQARVDWRMPRVSDSGVFVRGTGKGQLNIWCWDQGSGQLWGYKVDPKSNADKPVGEWNTFLITMKGDRLTLELNGIEVFTEQEMKGIPETGALQLQKHGDPMEWKNIYIRPLEN